MRKLDSTSVVKLKRADLSGHGFESMREIQEALLMIPGAEDPVKLRSNIVSRAEVILNEMSEEQYREFRFRLKGYAADRTTDSKRVYETSEEEKLLTRLLSADALEVNFHPDIWSVKTEYERVVKDPSCTGCAIRQALAAARKSLHEIKQRMEVVSD